MTDDLVSQPMPREDFSTYRDAKWMRQMAVNEPVDPAEAAVYWARLSREQADLAVRHSRAAMWWMAVAVGLLVLSVVLGLMTP